MVDPDKVLIGWKIWYGNGTVLKSKHNKWINCPQTNIQVVKLFYLNSDGTIEVCVHHGQEYYILDDLLHVPKEIKIGKSMEGEEFWEMYDRATKTDTELVTEMI